MKIINTKNADVIFTDNNKLLIGLKYKNTTPEFEVTFCNNDFQAFKKMMVFCDAPIIVEPETANELYEYCLKNCNFETEPAELYSVVEKHIYDMSLNSEQNTLPYKNCINIEKMIIEKLGKSAMPDEMVKNYEEWNVINNGREVLKNNLEKEIKRLELAQKFIFDSCPSWYPEEWIIVSVDKKYGIINKDFKFSIKPKYQMLSHIKNNIFLAKLDDKFYSIDSFDNTIAELICDDGSNYDEIEVFEGRFLKVKKQDRYIKSKNAYGVIDYNDNIILPLSEEYFNGSDSFQCYADNEVEYFSFGIYGQYGVVDSKGNNLIPLEYSEKIKLYKDFAIVAKYDTEKDRSLYGAVNYNNESKIPLIYKELNPIGHDLENITFAAKRLDDKAIIIDKFGKQICDIEFDYVEYLGYELYAVCIDDKYGAIDRFGNIKISFQDLIEYIGPFFRIDESRIVGYCSPDCYKRFKGHFGLIDDKGNVVIPCIYSDDPFYFREDFIITPEYLSNLCGIVDWNNNKMLDFLYDLIIPFGNYYFVNIRDKWGFIDKQGNVADLFNDTFAL